MDSIYSSFGRTIKELAERETDQGKKKQLLRLASELELMFNQQANNVQSALGGAEIAWHSRIDEVVSEIKAVQNAGNDTVSLILGLDSNIKELVGVIRDQGAAVVQLRMEFQEVAEVVNGIVKDVDTLKKSMRESVKERMRLSDESIENRSRIDEVGMKLDSLSVLVNKALDEIHGRPSIEETSDLIRRFHSMEDDIRDIKDRE